MISGDYKILTGIVLQAGWTGPQYPNKTRPSGGIYAFQDCDSIGCLYNIKDDPEERMNLAKSQPDIRSRNLPNTKLHILTQTEEKFGLALALLL